MSDVSMKPVRAIRELSSAQQLDRGIKRKQATLEAGIARLEMEFAQGVRELVDQFTAATVTEETPPSQTEAAAG